MDHSGRLCGGGLLTVKVGFSTTDVVVASSTVVEDESASSESSARTLPSKSAEE